MQSVRFKQRRLLWTLLVLQIITISLFAFWRAVQNPRTTNLQEQFSSSNQQSQGTKVKGLSFDTSACTTLRAPGRTAVNKDGFFSFITSYYFDRESGNLFVVALEKEYFKYTSTTRNYAINVSFPYESLVHPVRLASLAWIIGLSELVICVEVNTALKDVSIHDKIVMMKCTFDDSLLNAHEIDIQSVGEIFLVDDVRWQQDSGTASKNHQPNLCFSLDATRPHGRVAEFITRHESITKDDLEKSNKMPTIVMCIGGIDKFSWIIVRAIELQIIGFGIEHVYLGLNSEDHQLQQKYMKSFNTEILDRLSISFSPASSFDVVFSQGKVPFFNECLFWAKFYQDDLLAAWDGDEILLTPPPIQQMNLAQKLIEDIPDLLESGCYIELTAQTFLRTSSKPYDENGVQLDLITGNISNTNYEATDNNKISAVHEVDRDLGNLHKEFPFRAIYSCGNYSKSISVVKTVEFISMHLPEACELYPSEGQRFSARSASFVKRTSRVFLAHFVQAWIPDRYADRCPARNDVKDLEAFESAFAFKST